MLPFQRRFLRRALAPDVRLAALSLPRGNGKSSLAAWLLARTLTKGDPLHQAGRESHLLAVSVAQCRRTTWRLLREMLPDTIRIRESREHCEAVDPATGARVTVIASSAKSGQGLVRASLVVADEPGGWETLGGEAMYRALGTALGKPGSDLRVLVIGTLAPAFSGWWPALVTGGDGPGRHVYSLTGDPKRWDCWPEIRRVNPLMSRFPDSRRELLRERDRARQDDGDRAAFMSFRMNVPTRDDSEVLLSVTDWETVTSRPIVERAGRPTVGLHLSGGRSWSAAAGVWPNGRVEVCALAPAVPDLARQERRDRQPAGVYAALARSGALTVDEGRRVPRLERLLDHVRSWAPSRLVVSESRRRDVLDAWRGGPVVGRGGSIADSDEDLRAFVALATDGDLTAGPGRELLGTALGHVRVRSNGSGQRRIAHDHNLVTRCESVIAAVLAAGAHTRRPPRRIVRLHT